MVPSPAYPCHCTPPCRLPNNMRVDGGVVAVIHQSKTKVAPANPLVGAHITLHNENEGLGPVNGVAQGRPQLNVVDP